MMLYDPETGHRIKDKDKPGRIDWVLALMKRTGMLPQDWEVTHCLFGEHLLRLNPGKPVALVESEKTAVICAGLMPQFLWLATGGKSQLKAEIDIADWLLRERHVMPGSDRASPCHPERSEGSHHSRTFLDIQQYISPEVAGEVEALIEELGLEFFGKVERVEVEEDLPP